MALNKVWSCFYEAQWNVSQNVPKSQEYLKIS